MSLRVADKKRRKHGATRVRVQAAANAYCLRTYGDAYTGGTPRRLTLPSGPLWIVPVVFTSAGYGYVGEVGVVAVAMDAQVVLDATPKAEVREAGARLTREKRDDLAAAFHRARST
ncbi:MAG: hypothetical protein L0Y72_24290 [Gemmataceae bacterium]|nr:hypothetical protein [Gemmataceae bacterium]MCI0742166.1 hypothetical protein [Gemmataceae bacterium]